MLTFAEAEVALAERLTGYESRPQQQRFARAVEAVFANPANFLPTGTSPADAQEAREALHPRHLIAQAGCGTGKSLGYAIPAILSGRRVMISVTTKALQDQLAEKDLPFLQDNLGVGFTWTVLKGRSNYLCAARALAADEDDVPMLAQLLHRADDLTWSGLREDLGFEVSHAAWAKVCSDSDDCTDLGCSKNAEVNRCFASMARTRANDSMIVVVNHALLFTDLLIKAETKRDGMLGDYDLVVMDEAHEVEEIAASNLGGQFSEGSIRALTGMVRNWCRRHGDHSEEPVEQPVADALGAAYALFGVLEAGRINGRHLDEHVERYAGMYDALVKLREVFLGQTYRDARDSEKARRQKQSISNRLTGATERFTAIIADSFDETVRWVEVERGNRPSDPPRKSIKVAPINVAPFLREHFFSRYPTVLVSATMAVGGHMTYIANRLGIDNYDELDVGTPFDFTVQARLYVPVRLPEPVGSKVPQWETQANQEMVDLIRASRGRALVLFTSVAHMRNAYEVVRRQVPYPIKMQGQEPNRSLAAWFTETTEGVLFGTRSFFTGVDFQGETCSLVIISKMPFPVPTEPLTEARCEAIERNGGDAFASYTIPVMSLVLQQAFGRAIRHRSDKATVAILDPRLASKGYGKRIMRDLPPAPFVTDIGEVESFLREPSLVPA